MPIPQGYSFLTEDQAKRAKAAGMPVDKYSITDGENVYDGREYADEESANFLTRGVRQAALGAIPAVAGRLAGIGSTALAAPLGPGAPVVGLVGGTTAAIGTSIAQNAYLNSLAAENPSGFVARNLRMAEVDREKHPWSSALMALPALSKLGGGTFLPSRGTLPQMATGATLQGGIAATSDKLLTGQIDPVNLTTAIVGGGLMSKQTPGSRNFDRSALRAMRFSPETVNKVSPEITPEIPLDSAKQAIIENYRRTTGGGDPEAVASLAIPPHQRPDYNPDLLLSADPANLSKLGDFESSIATLRKQGYSLTPDDLTRLSQIGASQGYEEGVRAIMRSKLPEVEAQRTRLVQANEANQGELANITQSQATQNAVNSLVPSEIPVKSAEESAKAIIGRSGPVTEGGQMLKEYTALNKRRNELAKIARSLPDDARKVELLSIIGTLDEDIENLGQTIVRSVGKSTIVGNEPNPQALPKSPIAQERPKNIDGTTPAESQKGTLPKDMPSPEAPATVSEQVKRFREGNLQAVLLTPGEARPTLTGNEVLTPVGDGRDVLHDPTKIQVVDVQNMVKNNRLGELLQMGVPMKPEGLESAKSVVQLVSPEGTPVKDVVATPETKGVVTDALGKIAKPGDKVVEKPTAQVVAERAAANEQPAPAQEETKPPFEIKAGMRLKQTEGPLSFDVIVVNPTNGLVGIASPGKKTINTFHQLGELNRLLANGELILAPKEPVTPTRPVARNAPKAVKAAAAAEVAAETPTPSVERLKSSEPTSTIGIGDKVLAPDGTVLFEIIGYDGKTKRFALGKSQIGLVDRYATQKEFDSNTASGKWKLSPSKATAGQGQTVGQTGEGSVKELNFGPGQETARKIADKVKSFTRSSIELVRSQGELGNVIAKRFEAMNQARHAGEGMLIGPLLKAKQAVSGESAKRIKNYLSDLFDYGASKITLTPAEQKIASIFQEVMKFTGIDKTAPNAPLVADYDANGNAIKRPARMTANYIPTSRPSAEVQRILNQGKTNPKWTEIRQKIIENYLRQGLTLAQATKHFENLRSPALGAGAPNPEFAALRRAEGYSLPREYRADVFDSIISHVKKHVADMAWHRQVESIPEVGVALGYKDNGRGQEYPEQVILPNGDVIYRGSMNTDPARAVMRDYVGVSLPDGNLTEKLYHAVAVSKVQGLSVVKDVISTLVTLPEVAKISDITEVARALTDALAPGASAKAMSRGSLRPQRNATRAEVDELAGGVTKFADLVARGSGTEGLNTVQATMMDTFTARIVEKRIAAGDVEFLKKWGPIDPENYTTQQLVDYITGRAVRAMRGSYDFEELPSWLGRGSGSYFRPVFMLGRWSIGRANRFYDNVIKEAGRGNIQPLIGSILGGVMSKEMYDWIRKEIFERKPKERTWEEMINTKGKDAAYDIAAKADAIGYGGIFSSLAYMGLQMQHNEIPRGFSNPLFQTASDGMERVVQFLDAVQNDEVDLIPGLLTLGQAMLQDNVQIIRNLNELPDATGGREERIARRLGYMESKAITPSLKNPFSEAEMYRTGDEEGLAKRMRRDVFEKMKMPAEPKSTIRRAVRIMPDGQLGDYYGFIKDAQGANAATSALSRDIDRDIANTLLFNKAKLRAVSER